MRERWNYLSASRQGLSVSQVGRDNFSRISQEKTRP